MILLISEFCAWEQEKWSYVFDMDKQDPATINLLMSFIRLANAVFEEAKKEAESKPPPIPLHPIFNPHPVYIFGASRYSMEFFDELKEKGGRHTLVNNDHSLSLSDKVGYYTATNILLDSIISLSKMKSARNKIRDKRENPLYKNFESCLYVKKGKQTISE